MNGQLFQSYCAQYGDDLDLCQHRLERKCIRCPYCKWILRVPSPKKEQDNNITES